MIAAQKNISIKRYEFNRYNNTQNMMLQQSIDNKTLLLFVVVTTVAVFGFFHFILHEATLQGKFGQVSHQLSSVYLHIVLCFITKKTKLSVFISLSH